ncbi:Uncharacterised protein [Candidatus Tiddalikarchaeum anstoanum]|nr:Uncharacterised protein [Candidatus Tiddalikarchaeum anstoanum]
MTNKEEAECCPKLDTKKWDNKKIVWKNKLFIQDTAVQLFHMPLNFGPVVARMFAKLTKAGADPKPEDFLLLSYDPSPWKAEIYMNATKNVPGAANVRLSGTFLTKVFDGPYNVVPEWIKKMDEYVKDKKETVKKYYLYFTTCPKCAKKYGHNYAIVFAQI